MAAAGIEPETGTLIHYA